MSAPAPLMGPGAHTAYGDSFAAGAAEIAALLAEPPAWLDTSAPHDLVLSPMKPDVQRGRITATKYAWRWECQVRGPAGSPYAGRSYRVLVRLPVGYPRTPAKLQVLSTIVHDVVEVRDPYEGQLDESFYERLAERVETEGGAATDSGDGGGEGEGSGSDGLRFRIGTRVRCKIGAFAWESGRVIDTHYAEPSWPAGEVVPYQVRLDDGRLIYAPNDEETVIKREKSEAAARGGGSGTYTVRGVLALLVEALEGPLVDPAAAAEAAAEKQAEEEVEEAAADEAALSFAEAWTAAQEEAADREAAKEVEMKAEAAAADEVNERNAAEAAPAQEEEEASVKAAGSPAGEGGEEGGEDGSVVGVGSKLSEAARSATVWKHLAVRHQEEMEIIDAYAPQRLHPPLFAGAFDKSWLAPSFAQAFHGAAAAASCTSASCTSASTSTSTASASATTSACTTSASTSPPPPSLSALRALVEEVSPGIYAFDMLSPAFCATLLEELEHYEASGLPVSRPNSMVSEA